MSGSRLGSAFTMSPLKIKNHTVLFWFGILGIVFYVVSPIVFPHDHNLRQPELLPVYTLMLGLGQLIKGTNTINDVKKALTQETDEEDEN